MLTLNRIQNFANFTRPIFIVVQIVDEARNGALKIDIIFPERVIRIYQQCMRPVSRNFARHCFERISKPYYIQFRKSQHLCQIPQNQPSLPNVFGVISNAELCFRLTFFNI